MEKRKLTDQAVSIIKPEVSHPALQEHDFTKDGEQDPDFTKGDKIEPIVNSVPVLDFDQNIQMPKEIHELNEHARSLALNLKQTNTKLSEKKKEISNAMILHHAEIVAAKQKELLERKIEDLTEILQESHEQFQEEMDALNKRSAITQVKLNEVTTELQQEKETSRARQVLFEETKNGLGLNIEIMLCY